MATFDIRDYGATGDGRTNDATAIQAAIDACASGGGGRVLVPAPAVYLSGSLRLRSRVELHVERGAVLQASGDWAAITQRRVVSALAGGVVRPDTPETGVFLYAEEADQVAITGAGVIDGAGRHYVLADLGPIYQMPIERPFTVFLLGCTGVTVRDVTLRDGALWTLRLTGCTDVRVTGVRIDGDLKLPNCDGIDVDRCRNVRISDCDISCGDDAISLKACDEFPAYGACENVVITNCTLVSTSSAVVVGVDATSPIRNVVVSNCVVSRSHRGLSVNSGQDAVFENILFSDIVVETRMFDSAWWGGGEPIYVSAFPWHDDFGQIRNVRFVNVLARSENGVYISGYRPGAIDGVLLENVRVELDTWSGVPGGRYDRRPFDSGVGVYSSPTSGFHIDTADNVTLRHCEVAWGASRPDHFRYAVASRRADGLVIDDLRGESADPGRYPAVTTIDTPEPADVRPA